jgi:hypothetical protein
MTNRMTATSLHRLRLPLVVAAALIAVFVAVLSARVVTAPTKSAGAATSATAVVYQVPAYDTNCAQDDTANLQSFVDNLPPGSNASPKVVQFPSNGCYQVDSSLTIRDFQDYTFDGNGATLEQTNVVAAAYTLPPNDQTPVYCGGSNLYGAGSGPATINTSGIMLWVEGGCNLTFRDFNIEGSHDVASYTNTSCTGNNCTQNDSLIQINGVQGVTITKNTISNPWGDWITLFGVHEFTTAGENTIASTPTTDATITNNNFDGMAGRQGITPEYVTRAVISANQFNGSVTYNMFDLEADVVAGCECDVNINDNIITGGYGFLVAGLTGASIDRFAFTNNTVSGRMFMSFQPYEASNWNVSDNTFGTGAGLSAVNPAMINFSNNDSSPLGSCSPSPCTGVPTTVWTNIDIEGNTAPEPTGSTTGFNLALLYNGAYEFPNLWVRNNTLMTNPSAPTDQVVWIADNYPYTCANSVGGTVTVDPSEPPPPNDGNNMTASCTDPSLPAFVQPTAPTPPTAPPDYPIVNLVSGSAFPVNGSAIGGTQSVDALASDYPAGLTSTVSGVSSTVQFEVTGISNSLSNDVVATAGPTVYGFVASWNTTNVPDGTYWFYSATCNTAGNCSDSLPIIITVDNPTTSVLVPTNNANFDGVEYFDAGASDPLSVISTVQFEVSGNGLSNPVVVPAVPTIFGYIGEWNTSGIASGTYTLQSQACNTAGICATSTPISINIDADVTSAVDVPSTNPATVSGTQQILSATASDTDEAPGGTEKAGINSLQFEITGGSLSNAVTVTAVPYLFGWLAEWNTTSVPDGTYTLESVATDTKGVTGASPGVTVTVNN